ncbi:hypothetical protein ACU42Y_02345 [Proteus mirabilis]
MLEQPIKGYGYGNQLYHNVYNQQVKQHKNWVFKKSIGPHNVFLAFWFAGGILGLISLIYFCASFIAQGIQLIPQKSGDYSPSSASVINIVFRGLCTAWII